MVIKQEITDNYAIYCGDTIEVSKSLPDECVDFSIYSPPFCGLYNYSSDERDLSNCKSYQEFFDHYRFCVAEKFRITKPGRCSAVHCMDVPGTGNGPTAKMGCGANTGTGLIDFPGDIIRLHEELGFRYFGSHYIWKEPLGVRNRTMAKGLAHKQIVTDSILVDVASCDRLLLFWKKGTNKVPVSHPVGLLDYSGEHQIPHELIPWRGHTGKQTENRYSHWIWRQYASSFWDDIRIDNVVPFDASRDANDEKHPHPLQLDVIDRAIILRSNPGEVVWTPFMGVGSEVYSAVMNGRKAIGSELKETYFDQAVKNLKHAVKQKESQAEMELKLEPTAESILVECAPEPEPEIVVVKQKRLHKKRLKNETR